MSILISGKSSYKHIVSFNNLVTIDYVFVEIDEYRTVISNKSKLDTSQLIDFTNQIFSKITVLPRYVVSESNIKKATELTKDIDFDDIWFIALSFEYDIPLITRDTKLYTGLQKKGFRNIILFDHFLRSFFQ